MPLASKGKTSASPRLDEYQQKTDRLREGCPVRAAIDVVRGRWKPSILYFLKDKSKRFTELQKSLPGITAQALTVQLRQLEADEIVLRTVYPEIPVRVEYKLSPFGRSLSDTMDQLEIWGMEYLRRRATPKANQVKVRPKLTA